MAVETKIQWADGTFNGWMGCTKISPKACANCYAEVSTPSRRFGVAWGAGQPRRRTAPSNWAQPVKWNNTLFVACPSCQWRGEGRLCIEGGRCPSCKMGKPERAQRRIFCASLSDVFDNEVDPSWREDLFALIESTPNLDWLLLTKRIGLVHKMVPAPWMENGFPKHVWLGATIVDQTEADRDIPKLLALPASVRFLSMEPLMGPVNFRWMPYAHQAAGEDYRTYMERRGGVNHLESLRGIHWVIAGGESGHQARPMHPQWVRSLRDQCREAGVAFLFKQWGEWISKDAAGVALDLCYEKNRIGGWVERDGSFTAGEAAAPKDLATAAHVFRIGKSLAGSMLDGSEHLQFPRSVL